MDKLFFCRLVLIFVLTNGTVHSAELPAGGYDTLIQKGKSQLQAGSAEQAAVSGKAAIKMSTERWEGYALVGGALMNLKRYEEAADSLSEAIKRAPESKQPALRDLRRQCLLAESGSPAVANAPTPATATSQAEIVLWKSIENSTNPDDFKTYITQYPQGAFIALAQRHLEEDTNREQARIQQAATESAAREQAATWSDGSSSLTWTRHDSPGKELDHTSAESYCAQLKWLGYSNWRLPTSEEIRDISHRRLGFVRGLRSEFKIQSDTMGLWTSSPPDHLQNSQGGYIWVATQIFTGGELRALCVRSNQ
jgi:tetratricopeptide (TPR) repeat protein